MTAPTNNPTMIDITITDNVHPSKDNDNPSHHKTKAKKSSDKDCKQNDKKTSKKQANDTKNDETMISFGDTGDINNYTPLIGKIKHEVDIIFKNKKYTTPSHSNSR